MAKILIVEDDPLMSRMYQKIFKFEGYDVAMAGDGEWGFGCSQKRKTDLEYFGRLHSGRASQIV